MREKINLRFLLGVYIVLLGFIVIITAVVFSMYGTIAMTTKEVINIEACSGSQNLDSFLAFLRG